MVISRSTAVRAATDRVGDRRGDILVGVRHAPGPCHLRTGGGSRGGDRESVRVDDPGIAGQLPGRDELVAAGHDGHPRTLLAERAVPAAGGDHPEIVGPDPVAVGQDFARPRILVPRQPQVAPGTHVRGLQDTVALAAVLAPQDRIGRLGGERPGRDADGLSQTERTAIRAP